jgi:hypothetical protein
LLGLVVCLAVVAGAVFVVAKPFGGSSTSVSPSKTPTDSATVAPTGEATDVATTSPSAKASTGKTAVSSASPAKWVTAGSLTAARASTRLLVLADGRALVIGDDNICDPGPAWDSSMAAEVWAANKWVATGSLNAARNDLAAQPLANGGALVIGGTSTDTVSFSSTKAWDPKTGKWSDAGVMATARSYPASALLKDGRVIVIGGEYMNDPTDTILSTAEVYSPTTGTWTATGSLKMARMGATAVTLTDGRVLVVGGYTDADALADSEIWDSTSGKWTAVGASPVFGGFALVPLADGGALLAGGQNDAYIALNTSYRFDAKTGKWVPAGKMVSTAFNRVAAVLANGQVLVAGGLPELHKPAIAAAELFNPATGKWSATVPMPSPREQSGAVRLKDGSILVAGGDGGYIGPASAPWCPKSITETLRFIPAVP